MKLEGRDSTFIVIGENIHTTRVYLRRGKHIVTTPAGAEAVRFIDHNGDQQFLLIPDHIKKTQDYEEGRIKHMKIAVQAAMSGSGDQAKLGEEYLELQIKRQIDSGADFLDINVDEISVREAEQQDAMRWLVQFVQARSSVPLCVDSSNSNTIEIGLEAGDNRAGRQMLNSASLERMSALDLVGEHDACVIVTAAGESGMPQNAEERVTNASRMVDASIERGIALGDIYIDPLMFPISVDQQFGNHVFDAIRQLRQKYGPEIHITGGFSNVSFGLPCRKLINDAFAVLAIEAGADSGIVDPVANDLRRVFMIDQASLPFEHAKAMLLGGDPDCRAYLKAYRKKLFAVY
ncbi:MAG: dihydropteroate synthase [Betaproteobacteria bacterium]|nr:MAG: dihydropteroate synthase [Betaproteobacteria bacterium]